MSDASFESLDFTARLRQPEDQDTAPEVDDSIAEQIAALREEIEALRLVGQSVETSSQFYTEFTETLNQTLSAAQEDLKEAEQGATDALENAALAVQEASEAWDSALAAHEALGQVQSDITTLEAKAVAGSTTEYAVSSDESTAPTTGWSTTPPDRTPGTFVWSRTRVTYADGTDSPWTEPFLQTGNTGPSLYTWVKYADDASGTGLADEPANKSYIGIAYNQTSETESTDPEDYSWSLIQGSVGEDGRAVLSTEVTYQASSSGTAIPTGTWVGTPPDAAPGQYIWTRTTFHYDKAPLTSDTYSVGKIGETGTSGRGIVSATTEYQLADSGTAAPVGTWSPDPLVQTTALPFLWSRTTTTYTSGSPSVGYSVSQRGSDAAPAPTISLSALTQVLVSPSTGTGATTPTSTTVTGTANNTSITVWEYATNGGAFAATPLPAGVTRSGNVVTIVGGSLAAGVRTVAVRASGGGVSDTLTVAKVLNGAAGGAGSPGADAITVLLTNQAHTFAGANNLALADSTTTDVLAFKGSTPVSVDVGTIGGQIAGKLTASVVGDNTTNPTITVNASATLDVQHGELTIPLTVDGKTFSQTFSWSVAFTGRGISSTDVTYQASSSGTTPPSGGTWSANPPTAQPGQYVWSRTITTYTSGPTSTAYSVGKIGENGTNGSDGVGVSGTEIRYQTGSSGTVPPGGTWVADPPAASPGQYVWTRTTTSYTNSTSTTAYSVGRIGSDGNPGDDGVGISSTEVRYQLSSSGTANPTGTWSATPLVQTAALPYLWTRTVITYTDTTTSTAYSVARRGDQGDAGRGIASTLVEYAIGPSATQAPTSGWGTSVLSPTVANPYLWTRTTVTYTTGTPATSILYSVSKMGDKGDKGDKGDTGNDGAPGAAGVGIASTAITYSQSTSGTTAPTSGWQSTVPTLIKGRYLWTRSVWTYTDNSTETGYSVAYVPQDGADGEDGLPGAPGVGITNTTITYAQSTSGTAAPETGWGDQPPTPIAGRYVWTKTVWTYSDNTTETGYSVGKIGDTGAKGDTGNTGAPAKVVSLTATTQVLTSPATGGATSPATAVVTGTATNTTITVWQYAVDTAPTTWVTIPTTAGWITRSGNTVTITGSTMTARTVTVRMADASGVADTLTVAKVRDGAKGDTGSTGGTGAPGAPGADGADAITPILSNESHVFPGSTTAALAGSTTTTIIAYKGATRVPITVTSITGAVTGISAAVTSGSGTNTVLITVTADTNLVALSGKFQINMTIDGKAITREFSWSVSRTGAKGDKGDTGNTGNTGVSVTKITPLYQQRAQSAGNPTQPANTVLPNPPTGWSTTEPAWVANTKLFRLERVEYSNSTVNYTPFTDVSSYALASAAKSELDTLTGTTLPALNDELEEKLGTTRAEILSMGTDLIVNGSGLMGDNTNFSQFIFDPTDAPVGSAGSFVSPVKGSASTLYNNEYIPVDPGKKYILSGWARETGTPATATRFYVGMSPFMADKSSIAPQYYYYMPDSETTLAQPLANGSTTAVLTSGAGASWGLTSNIYLGIWNWTDSFGKTWPFGTLTKNVPTIASVSGNTVTLTAPWSGATVPAGTKVTVNRAGGTFMYNGASNKIATPEWERFASSTLIGGVHDGTLGAATWSFPPGTAFVRLLFLVNRYDANSQQAFAGLSLSDASAAQSVADATSTLTTGWTRTGTTQIDGGKIYADSVTAAQIAADAITANEIASRTILATHIKANEVTANEMKTGTITAASGIIGEAAIQTAHIENGAITNLKVNDLNVNKLTGTAADFTSTFTQNLLANNAFIDNLAATRLIVGASPNLIKLGNLQSNTAPNIDRVTGGWATQQVGTASLAFSGWDATYGMSISAVGPHIVGNPFELKRGEKYTFTATARSTSSSKQLRIEAVRVTRNGTTGPWSVTTDSFDIRPMSAVGAANTTVEISDTGTAPVDGTYFLRFSFNTATGIFYINDLRLVAQLKGTLIENGTITSDKLNVNSAWIGSLISPNIITTKLVGETITGTTISGSTITGTTINGGTINSVTLNSATINSGSITMSKPVSGGISSISIAVPAGNNSIEFSYNSSVKGFIESGLNYLKVKSTDLMFLEADVNVQVRAASHADIEASTIDLQSMSGGSALTGLSLTNNRVWIKGPEGTPSLDTTTSATTLSHSTSNIRLTTASSSIDRDGSTVFESNSSIGTQMTYLTSMMRVTSSGAYIDRGGSRVFDADGTSTQLFASGSNPSSLTLTNSTVSLTSFGATILTSTSAGGTRLHAANGSGTSVILSTDVISLTRSGTGVFAADASNTSIASGNSNVTLSNTNSEFYAGTTANISGTLITFTVRGPASTRNSWDFRSVQTGTTTKTALRFNGGSANMPTTTIANNMYMHTDGYVYISSSSAKNKVDVKDISTDPIKVLDVAVRDWYDREEAESYAALLDGEEDVHVLDGDFRRIPGVVAEELEEIGLQQFVTYGSDGEPNGVMYERIALLLIPVVKEQQARLDALENLVQELTN